MSDDRTCPCGPLPHPLPVTNLPGLAFVRFRAATFAQFRTALLTPRTAIDPATKQAFVAETELLHHRPGPSGDLAVQAVEWWAYLGDILTFYNEQLANRALLRTAGAGDVERLARLIGYRPRPGMGSKGFVGAVVQTKLPLNILAGLGVQSKPGPGEEPQIFGSDKDTLAEPRGIVDAEIIQDVAVSKELVLRGSPDLKVGDPLVLVKKTWGGGASGAQTILVAKVVSEKDPSGRSLTRIHFNDTLAVSGNVKDFLVVRHSQSAHLYLHTAESVVLAGPSPDFLPEDTASTKEAPDAPKELAPGGISPAPEKDPPASGITINLASSTNIHLDSPARSLVGKEVLLVRAASVKGVDYEELRRANTYTEEVWYANATAKDKPQDPPTGDKVVPLPVLHAVVNVVPGLANKDIYNTNRTSVEVRFGYRSVADLVSLVRTWTGTELIVEPATTFTIPSAGRDVLVEDATGGGAMGKAQVIGNSSRIKVTFESQVTLKPPIRLLTNPVAVSRGAPVNKEILGSGDNRLLGQRFWLKKSPLTYYPIKDPAFPRGYKSSLRVWVNGIEWKEVERLYGQPPTAEVFATAENDKGDTEVIFGDGLRGSRLPSGVNNIVASYRFGSGSEAPGPGALSVLLTPRAGLTQIHGPVPPSGGTDPDPAEKTKSLAPKSVFTFGRAVSGIDYEALALEAPGVTRAKASFVWDEEEQRTLVEVYVTGDSGALAAAKEKILPNSDPNRPVKIKLAQKVAVNALVMVVDFDARYDKEAVKAAVTEELLNEETGLFGSRRLPIEKAVYESEVRARVHQVAGVISVRGLTMLVLGMTGPRYYPGIGKVFELSPQAVALNMEESSVSN